MGDAQTQYLDTENELEEDIVNEYMKDNNFSVYSDPKFLYIMGKICARSKLLMYSDLAIQSFHDYFLIITYYKSYVPDRVYIDIKIKTYLWLARIFLNAQEFE